jgi:hypothetical protein
LSSDLREVVITFLPDLLAASGHYLRLRRQPEISRWQS